MSEHEGDGYYAEVEKNAEGGWDWTVRERPHGRIVGERGYEAFRRNGLVGTTWTRWGARSEARTALKRLRRYLDRERPEVVDA